MLSATLGNTLSDNALRKAFFKWQCRVRQIAMRENEGRPDDAITPELFLPGQQEALGHIITIMNKAPMFSVTPEMEHMCAKTNDPAQRREQALRYFSSTYYQKAPEFADILTATFPPKSPGAASIRSAEKVRLVFDAYAQRFDLTCRVWKLASNNPFYRSTMAHNQLFNPGLHPDTEVLGFEPEWDASTSEPAFH